jgi:hypothetical protein
MIPMGQEEYKEDFPNSVWPSSITDAVPLSAMVNGTVAVNIPNSDAQDGAGNTYTWGGIVGELGLFGAGAFSDTVTYYTELMISSDGPVEIETAYLLWNDVAGPRHLLNLWVGRLMNPQLTSFGLHSSYVADAFMPAVSVVGLYNPTSDYVLGQGHTDGVEANGIIEHRVGWSAGWLASGAVTGLNLPNAEDAYVHIGVKSGGVALDGEGRYGPNAPDPMKPWAEKSITFDAFTYHGMIVLDNGTGTVAGVIPATPVAQRDRFNAIGGAIRGQLDSLIVSTGLQWEHHARPYPGTAATAGPPPVPGVPDYTDATAFVHYDEIDYVIFPWLVPALRLEFTRTTFEASTPASLFRLIPGVAMLVRPNIKVVVAGDFERAQGLPPAGDWGQAGGQIVAPGPGVNTNFEAEQINATVGLAF